MRAVDLFSGCGGLSKGLQNAGLDVTLGVEMWEPARAVYAANFEHPAKELDLSGVNDAAALVRRQKPMIIAGGPPCQEFSAAGMRVEGKRAKLTETFARIVIACDTEWFLFENVLGAESSEAWTRSRRLFQRAGFGITEVMMNAAHYGVPQYRKRFFAIGRRGEDDGFLLDELEDRKSEDALTVRDYVGDEFGIDYYYRHPRTWGRRAVFSIDEPSPTIRSTNRPVPPGYKRHENDSGPSHLARPLSPAERARVQTFDRKFQFFGTMTDQNVMIANAVPVNLAHHVGAAILSHQQWSATMPGDRRFRTWLENTQDYTPRTISNVLSRLKRAGRILNASRLSSDPLDTIHALERRKEFTNLSASVRSQIKKAVRLHSIFLHR